MADTQPCDMSAAEDTQMTEIKLRFAAVQKKYDEACERARQRRLADPEGEKTRRREVEKRQAEAMAARRLEAEDKRELDRAGRHQRQIQFYRDKILQLQEEQASAQALLDALLGPCYIK
jgi:hypothetical protein